MIQVYLRGGLGNQLFQYAAAKALQRRLNTDLEINVSYVEADPIRQYELGAFPMITEPIVRGETLGRVVEEGGIEYQPRILDLPNVDLTLVGYWQCEKYFAPIADEIRAIYGDTWLGVGRKGLAAVHIRRGDYLTPATRAVMGELPMTYYGKATAALYEKGFHRFNIFSDDPAWVEANCQWGVAMPRGVALADLRWMAGHGAFIIANSSFSWWAAWLSGSEHVVAPAQWFNPNSGLDGRDVVPDRWLKI